MSRNLYLFCTWCGCFGSIGFLIFFLTIVVTTWPGVDISDVIGGLNLWLTMIFISFFFGTMSWWFAFARNRGDQQGDSLDKK